MKPIKSPWQGDRNYHDRHQQRSYRRVELISANLAYSSNFLDIGCNSGLAISYLFEHGKIASATGIELADNAVDPTLLSDPRFSLIQGDICEIGLEDCYEAIFYGAVHHHIVRERGLGKSIEVLQKLSLHCKGTMFFETGHLSEGSRWQWQRAIRKYFRTDEEHVNYLLKSIEPAVTDFEVIGLFRIHGIRRWFMKIGIDGSKLAEAFRNAESLPELNCEITRKLGRTFGSRNQTLLECRNSIDDSGVEFMIGKDKEQEIFIKKRKSMPHIDKLEYAIGRQVNCGWAVKPTGYYKEGIAFPYLEAIPFERFISNSTAGHSGIRNSLLEIWKDACNSTIVLESSLLVVGGTYRLIDIVDFNICNFLVLNEHQKPKIKVVDFEFHSHTSIWKNRLGFSKMLFLSGSHWHSFTFLICGVLALIKNTVAADFMPPSWRAKMKRPALTSAVYTGIRSRLELAAAKVFPFLDSK